MENEEVSLTTRAEHKERFQTIYTFSAEPPWRSEASVQQRDRAHQTESKKNVMTQQEKTSSSRTSSISNNLLFRLKDAVNLMILLRSPERVQAIRESNKKCPDQKKETEWKWDTPQITETVLTIEDSAERSEHGRLEVFSWESDFLKIRRELKKEEGVSLLSFCLDGRQGVLRAARLRRPTEDT